MSLPKDSRDGGTCWGIQELSAFTMGPQCLQRDTIISTKSWQVSAVICTAQYRVFRLSQASTGEHNRDVFLCRKRASQDFQEFLETWTRPPGNLEARLCVTASSNECPLGVGRTCKQYQVDPYDPQANTNVHASLCRRRGAKILKGISKLVLLTLSSERSRKNCALTKKTNADRNSAL